MPNLSLYHYENKWLLHIKKEIFVKDAFLVIYFVLQTICLSQVHKSFKNFRNFMYYSEYQSKNKTIELLKHHL